MITIWHCQYAPGSLRYLSRFSAQVDNRDLRLWSTEHTANFNFLPTGGAAQGGGHWEGSIHGCLLVPSRADLETRCPSSALGFVISIPFQAEDFLTTFSPQTRPPGIAPRYVYLLAGQPRLLHCIHWISYTYLTNKTSDLQQLGLCSTPPPLGYQSPYSTNLNAPR